MKQTNNALLYASIAVVSWSTVATAFKIALRHLTSFEMIMIASFTALLVFTFLLTYYRKWKVVRGLSLADWKYFSFIALINPIGYYLFLFKAYDLLPAQIAQPVSYIWPIVLFVLLSMFTSVKVSINKIFGMIISLMGVVLITSGSSLNGTHISSLGIVIAFVSAFFFASYWLFSNKKNHIDPMVTLFMTFLFASFYLFIAALFVGVNPITFSGLSSGIYIGLFEMAIPFVFFSMAIRQTSSPALVNQMCYLAPFFSLFFISLFLGEKILMTTYVGLFLIVLGILYNQYIVERGVHFHLFFQKKLIGRKHQSNPRFKKPFDRHLNR